MRIRSVKPEYWTHPTYGRLDDQTKWIAIALLNLADDHGYFLATPEYIKGQIAPFQENFLSFTESLKKLSLVGWYEVFDTLEMGPVGCIKNWSKHQKVNHPSKSKLMTYVSPENFCKPQEIFLLEQGTGNREHGTYKASVSESKIELLKAFKKSYPPKGIENPNVEKNFFRLLSEGVDAQLIIAEAKAYTEYWKLKCGEEYPNGSKAFISQAENWLYKREYADGWSEKLKSEKAGAPVTKTQKRTYGFDASLIPNRGNRES